ncbi:MAG: DNA polymerase III subunit delta [bacterium]|nr:DNA polymerase III subunit delta [bacterium]
MTGSGRRNDRTPAPPAILFISPEPFLLAQAEQEAVHRLMPLENRDLNLLIAYGWETDLGTVVEFLQTLPFLGDRRLLVLREVNKLPDYKELTTYLKDPNPKSTLLMTSSELKRSDSGYRVLSPLCEASELKPPYGRSLAGWVRTRFRNQGKEIDNGLCELLVQISGENLGLLATEIDKVVLSAGDKGSIAEEDLDVSVPGGVEVIFNFLDALGDGDSSRALLSLKSLVDSDNAPEYIVHMMAWHYRQLIRGKDLVRSGLSPGEAALKMGKRYPKIREKFTRHMGRVNEDDLVRALDALATGDLELKRGSIPEAAVLDRMVLELLS